MAAIAGRQRATEATSLWAALAVGGFRALCVVELGGTIGIWVHTVAAQWLITASGRSSTLVALVQTALTLPFFVLAMPTGLVADVVDRRRLLVGSSAAMAGISLALAVATSGGQSSVPVLLGSTLLLGAASTVSTVVWQSMVPDVVGRGRVASATTLGGMVFNSARTVGPALGGGLLWLAGPSWVFGIDAVAFAVTAVVARAWTPRSAAPGQGTRWRTAFAGGLRFVRHSPWTRRLLLRVVLFTLPASALWALLPVVAHSRLGLGSAEFGVLFAAVGTGAVLGAVAVHPIRVRMETNTFLALASTAFATAMAIVAVARPPVLVGLALLVTGAGWTTVLTTFIAAAQTTLPSWVRARGLAGLLLVFQGCQAFGALGWGALADLVGVSWSCLAAAAVLACGAVSLRWWRLQPTAASEPVPMSLWREQVPVRGGAATVAATDGPVQVLVDYQVRADRRAEFLAAMARLEDSRRRLGASRWLLYRDEANGTFVESYTVASWGEYLHQESVRLTVAEKRIRDAAEQLADRPPVTRRLVASRSHARVEPSAG